jgi:hypothetical protein
MSQQSSLRCIIACLLVLVVRSVSALQPPELPRKPLPTRRSFVVDQGAMLLVATAAVGTGVVVSPASAAAAATTSPTSFPDLLEQIQKAQAQLDKIPSLIETEKWDSVRAILIEPPLADCWAKTNRPLLPKYAEELGNAGGDELAALEAKEELVSHLRYLDMAVYNNVFNPIKTEGTNGATKELIRSYYEDPTNEFKASKTAFQELIGLSKEL